MQKRAFAVVQQKGADFSVRGKTTSSGGPGVTILCDGVEVFAGTAYITADEAELHEDGPIVHVRGNATISLLGNPRRTGPRS